MKVGTRTLVPTEAEGHFALREGAAGQQEPAAKPVRWHTKSVGASYLALSSPAQGENVLGT